MAEWEKYSIEGVSRAQMSTYHILPLISSSPDWYGLILISWDSGQRGMNSQSYQATAPHNGNVLYSDHGNVGRDSSQGLTLRSSETKGLGFVEYL